MEYAFFWILGGAGFLGWPVALFLALSNRSRLIRIEKMIGATAHA